MTVINDTNITDEMREDFEAVTSGEYDNVALLSCFLDGKPTAAIVAVNRDGSDYTLTPLFVYATDEIRSRLTDHDGKVPFG